MNLLQLQYFRTIAQYENISRAAEVLCVAQPNLSTSMTRLEDELGTALFDRRRGRIRLTPTGELFLGYVIGVLDRLDEGVLSVREAGRLADEQLRVASSIVDLMGLLLSEFLPAHSGIAFRQIGCRNAEILPHIIEGRADIGFLFGSCPDGALEYTRLDSCERIVLMSQDHPLASNEIVSLHELDSHRLVCNLSRDDETFLSDTAHTTGCHLQPFYACDDNRSEVSMLLQGGAVSVSPLSNYLKLINKDPRLPLVCRRLREEVPPACIGMVRRSGERLTKSALQFYELTADFFDREHSVAESFARTLPER